MLTGFISACSSPAGRVDQLAERLQFERTSMRVGRFDLTVYRNDAFDVTADNASTDNVLHVYLEGDGEPWKWKVLVMPDPTPRRPLMLGLMSVDTAPSVYLGRPCYHGESQADACKSDLWTSARYSEPVVDSMARGVRLLARQRKATAIRLFGHSGGGALALLLAERLPLTRDVVTLAGNLDPDSWTEHHGYLPLSESLNPARRNAIDTSIRQWHLIGGADRVVPPVVVSSYLATVPEATVVAYPTFTHGCCWSRIWSGVLQAVVKNSPGRLPKPVSRPGAPTS